MEFLCPQVAKKKNRLQNLWLLFGCRIALCEQIQPLEILPVAFANLWFNLVGNCADHQSDDSLQLSWPQRPLWRSWERVRQTRTETAAAVAAKTCVFRGRLFQRSKNNRSHTHTHTRRKTTRTQKHIQTAETITSNWWLGFFRFQLFYSVAKSALASHVI